MDCIYKQNCKETCSKDFCLKQYKLNYLYDEALISEIQRKYIQLRIDKDHTDFDEFTKLKQIENNIKTFVAEGKSLYIHSVQCGNGKTSWALRLVQEYFNQIWYSSDLVCRALFINVPRFLIALKDNISEKNNYINHIKENIYKADIIIWDDIGNKAITQFECDNLLYMIDGRINEGKANIFTSNLNDSELHQYLGDRLYSRIVSMSENIELHGADKRGLLL